VSTIGSTGGVLEASVVVESTGGIKRALNCTSGVTTGTTGADKTVTVRDIFFTS
jgi:hypothetical protein